MLFTNRAYTKHQDIHDKDTASKELIMRMESVYVGDIACPVRGGGPRPQKVFVHNYPFEASSDSLSLVLKRFGDVKDISHRRWLHLKDIFDGVRVVTMIRDKPIPRNLDVDGFHVKVSYYGQSVECDICNNHGHVARDCPLNGKCLWCHQPGHLQRDCTNPPAGDNSDVGSSEGRSPSGPPAPVNVDTSSFTGYCVVSSCGSLRSCGCIILYRPIYNLLKSHIDLEGRFLLCSFSFRDISFNISCLYAPNRNLARNDFSDGLADTIDLTFPTFICGDFNTVLDRSMDRFGSNVSDYSQESSQALAHLFDSCCTIDIWRYLHPTSKQFTWSARNGSLSSRIDLIGCPVAWVPSMSSSEILPFPFSDHCAVLLSGSFPSLIPPGPGVWKLNISTLENDDYFELISSFWRSWKFRKSSFVSIIDWWGLGKSKIKGLTVTYCKKRVAAQREKRNLLCNLVEHLKRKIDNGSTSCVGAYKNALVNLGKKDLEAANGARVRSRVQWAEEGETSSKYFLRLEKKNKAERWVSALKDEDDIIHSDVDGISQCVVFLLLVSLLL